MYGSHKQIISFQHSPVIVLFHLFTRPIGAIFDVLDLQYLRKGTFTLFAQYPIFCQKRASIQWYIQLELILIIIWHALMQQFLLLVYGCRILFSFLSFFWFLWGRHNGIFPYGMIKVLLNWMNRHTFLRCHTSGHWHHFHLYCLVTKLICILNHIILEVAHK